MSDEIRERLAVVLHKDGSCSFAGEKWDEMKAAGYECECLDWADAILPVVNALIGAAYKDAIEFSRRHCSAAGRRPSADFLHESWCGCEIADGLKQRTAADAVRELKRELAEARHAERERASLGVKLKGETK